MSRGGTDNSLWLARPQFEPAAGGGLLCRAPAKLNLTLRVLGRREDGYHELDSIVAKLTLYDELTFRPRGDGQILLKCAGYDCGPPGENLAVRAAELLREKMPGAGAEIHLAKRIPPGTGLGGGSSDAAAALQALNRLWGVGLSRAGLGELAGQIGSDVPLFLDGPSVRIRGRGERVQPLAVHPFWAAVWLPNIACDTARVYARYDEMAADRAAASDDRSAPAAIADLADKPASRWRDGLFNDLRAPAEALYPQLAEASDRLASSTAVPVHMTGSGSALFTLFDEQSSARRAVAELPEDMRTACRVVGLNAW